MASCGRLWASVSATSPGQVVSVVSPHPGMVELTTTDTSPVACRAAAIPRELSTITLSPKIQARYGCPATAVRRGWTRVTVRAGAGRAAATEPLVAGGGPTVPATMIAAVTPTPTAANPTVGTWRRRCRPAQSSRRSGRSIRV
jgi:hypothetical protein